MKKWMVLWISVMAAIITVACKKAPDMPDGYYIYNPDTAVTTLKLTKETNYLFIDWGRDFVDTDLFEDIQISTTSRELFRSYLGTYPNSTPGMPFFFEVEGDTVRSIVERPIM